MNVRFWKEHFAYYQEGSSDYYQIYPELEFSEYDYDANVGKI